MKILFYILLINVENYFSRPEQKINCNELNFCKRQMDNNSQKDSLKLIKNSMKFANGTLEATVKGDNNLVDLSIDVNEKGIFRIKFVPVNSKRFVLTEEDDVFIAQKGKKSKISYEKLDKYAVLKCQKNMMEYYVEIYFEPFKMIYRVNNVEVIAINKDNLLFFEEPSNENVTILQNNDDAMKALRFEFTIKDVDFLSGLPERAGTIFLEDTKGDELYHFYDIDAFKYKNDKYNTIYGVIPFIFSRHNSNKLSGIFYNNPSETFIKLETTNTNDKKFTVVSEEGIIDFLFFTSENYENFYKKMKAAIGPTKLPPIFALGYHQSRYNYKTIYDTMQVLYKYDYLNVPFDSLWLDIDHTSDKRYFTYDLLKFPEKETKTLINKLTQTGRKLILIVDPHIKVDSWYNVYNRARANQYFVRNSAHPNNFFVGRCWCGEAAYLDFYNRNAREFWKQLYVEHKSTYFYDSDIVHIWNDMNEPSVFHIDRNTIPKKCLINYDGTFYEHRAAHNIYGHFMVQATYDVMRKFYSDRNTRPFVLTRSFYIGTHRYAAMWTGDNTANFENIEVCLNMLGQLSVSGYSLSGCDIGGFGDTSEVDLMKRWYQVGVFYPFFRGHSHIESRRRELYLYSEHDFNNMRTSIIYRYQIIPYIYTEFFLHFTTGLPVVRPLYIDDNYQKAKGSIKKFMQSEYYFGSAILVRPVKNRYESSSNKVEIFLPENSRWYNFYSYREELRKGVFNLGINAQQIGAFYKGGAIIPKKMRTRRSTEKMKNDPLTLLVFLDSKNEAKGMVYFDDERSFNYEEGAYSLLSLEFRNNVLNFEWKNYGYNLTNKIEKIIICGLKNLGETPTVEMGLYNNNDYYLYIESSIKDNSTLELKKVNINSEIKTTNIKYIKLYL